MFQARFGVLPLFRTVFLTAALLGVSAGLSACNTIRGAGQDVSSVGHDVSRGARVTQNAITRATSASPN
ncbi:MULTISPECIES: entericidin A/B family lipoprotein [Nguyenibacter]|uniref:Entericidin A/B family lipoprotein n=1 Tax=Nguyenibacter vanlangensis TaxID=1216886 RepID=A0A7Y7M3Q9_9PROT|nr:MULTISPECIES: entericidin A/B family lipoprotein [Nguyenibacter]NVN09955.1 entericidin A/B family lipoprotein [Nguyenibacter vanlangensis]WRH86792.1 entericidin A/B family lipoprotein [Nguyenibacter sp. L1]